MASTDRHPFGERVALPGSALTGLPRQEGPRGKAYRSSVSIFVGCPSGHSRSAERPKLFVFGDVTLAGRDVAVAGVGVRRGAGALLPGAITVATTRHAAMTSPATS